MEGRTGVGGDPLLIDPLLSPPSSPLSNAPPNSRMRAQVSARERAHHILLRESGLLLVSMSFHGLAQVSACQLHTGTLGGLYARA